MTMVNTNFHTHTTYCDGEDTPRAIVETAIRSCMSELGFSGHSYTPFDESYCMSEEGTCEYFDEIGKLRDEYSDSITIRRGIERDYFSDPDDGYDWDYVIGSIHYVLKDGEYIPVDETEKILIDGVNSHYDGDIMSFIEDYYKLVGDVANKTGADIVGHFDLVTKFNEGGRLFDEDDPRYIKAWRGALDALHASDGGAPIIEINTGAMSRGYRNSPYPSLDIFREIVGRGFDVIMSSDAHNKGSLQYGFDQIVDMAMQMGATPVTTLPES